MRKFKRIAAAAIGAALVASVFAGCGNGSSEEETTKAASDETTAEGETSAEGETTGGTETSLYEYTPVSSDDGTELNIYTWNTEFIERFVAYYPDYEANDAEDVTAGGKIGDVTVNFIIVANDNNGYQNNLDEVLLNNGAGQENASASDKIDLFLVESDFALKYVDTNYTIALSDVGVDTTALADQYKYTQDVVTDAYGKLKGSSWQACPAALIYNAEIAEAVLGTSDPDEVQEYVKDWDTFLETAAKLAEAGYLATASVNDTYRVFSNNVSSKWVIDGVVNIDDAITDWVELSKSMVDAGYTTTYELWSTDWSAGFNVGGNVFSYFGPAWFIDFSMNGHDEDDKDYGTSIADNGGWRVCEGPQPFFWGGTWICAANGTDNASLVADIITKMTSDDEILTSIITKNSDYVNDSELIANYIEDDSFGDAILGGQNPLGIFAAGISNIDLSNMTSYDQGMTEEFQDAMKNYFDGNATYEEALKIFYDAITVKYPDLSVPED